MREGTMRLLTAVMPQSTGGHCSFVLIYKRAAWQVTHWGSVPVPWGGFVQAEEGEEEEERLSLL